MVACALCGKPVTSVTEVVREGEKSVVGQLESAVRPVGWRRVSE